MEHDDFKALILLLPDGELSEQEKEQAERHLKGCTQCADLASGAEVSQRLFAGGPLPAGSEVFAGAVMDRIKTEENQGVEIPVRWWAPALALGVVCAAFIMGGVLPSTDISVDELLVYNVDGEDGTGAVGFADFMVFSAEEW